MPLKRYTLDEEAAPTLTATWNERRSALRRVTLLTCVVTFSAMNGQAYAENDEAEPSTEDGVLRDGATCDGITCSEHGRCVVLDGSATCECDARFRADPADPTTCVEVSEESTSDEPRGGNRRDG